MTPELPQHSTAPEFFVVLIRCIASIKEILAPPEAAAIWTCVHAAIFLRPSDASERVSAPDLFDFGWYSPP